MERRLADVEKLKKVRALEEVVEHELDAIEREQEGGRRRGREGEGGQRREGAGRTEGTDTRTEGGRAQGGRAPGGGGGSAEGGKSAEGGVLEKELLQKEQPPRAAGQRSAGQRSSQGQAQFDPMPKLKQISLDLQDLIEEIDAHARQ